MGEGKGGGPLAKSRRQSNRGSNGRPLCSCAFPIGNSKRLRFFRTHTHAQSRKQPSNDGTWRLSRRSVLLPQTSARLPLLVAHAYDTENRGAARCKQA